jgi:hypothetical protein
MKNISPIWFIKDPIDPEHKEYVLLDYLKSISKNLNSDNCYSTLRSVSKIIKSLNEFKDNKKISSRVLSQIKQDERDYVEKFIFDDLADSDKNTIIDIVESSLETLYEYSEVCLEILKQEESKIRIFSVNSKLSSSSTEKQNSGILVVRNMITDKIISYYWQGAVTLKTADGDKEICVLKRIHLKNQTFSLNYKYIYHEILEEFAVEKKMPPELHVIEIYENFDENSEIYKLAKEKFIETVS